MPVSLRAFSAAVVAIVLTAAPGAAQQSDDRFISEEGASERMDEAGRLRMLSQRIAAAKCYAHADIAADAARAQLGEASEEYDRIIDALTNGDDALGIHGAEDNVRILARLERLQEVWNPMRDAIAAAPVSDDVETVVFVYEQSTPLLEAAQLVVSEVVGDYSDPTAVMQADALRIDIAGRQRMLAQRVSKATCMALSDLDREMAVAELESARSLYTASANALRNGMPQAGVQPTEDAAILSALDAILDEWASMQGVFDAALAGQAVSDADAEGLFHAMNDLTRRMDEVVGMFSANAKQNL